MIWMWLETKRSKLAQGAASHHEELQQQFVVAYYFHSKGYRISGSQVNSGQHNKQI